MGWAHILHVGDLGVIPGTIWPPKYHWEWTLGVAPSTAGSTFSAPSISQKVQKQPVLAGCCEKGTPNSLFVKQSSGPASTGKTVWRLLKKKKKILCQLDNSAGHVHARYAGDMDLFTWTWSPRHCQEGPWVLSQFCFWERGGRPSLKSL